MIMRLAAPKHTRTHIAHVMRDERRADQNKNKHKRMEVNEKNKKYAQPELINVATNGQLCDPPVMHHSN